MCSLGTKSASRIRPAAQSDDQRGRDRDLRNDQGRRFRRALGAAHARAFALYIGREPTVDERVFRSEPRSRLLINLAQQLSEKLLRAEREMQLLGE